MISDLNILCIYSFCPMCYYVKVMIYIQIDTYTTNQEIIYFFTNV